MNSQSSNLLPLEQSHFLSILLRLHSYACVLQGVNMLLVICINLNSLCFYSPELPEIRLPCILKNAKKFTWELRNAFLGYVNCEFCIVV